MATRAAELVAGIIDRIEGRPYRTGRPPLPTVEVVETLRFFVRGGVQWRELRAAAGRACGSTLRRRLDEWSATALLRRVPVALVRMVRAGPGAAASWDVVVDSCPVRAKRGGELTGPNPTDRGKAGTEYHVVASTDGLPLGVVPSAANVHDTRLFPHLLRLALAVCAAIGRPEFAVRGHTAKFMLGISGLGFGGRVPTSTPACPRETNFVAPSQAVTRRNVCLQTANSGQAVRRRGLRQRGEPRA